MKRAILIIANNYRGNGSFSELNVGRDMVGLGGFFDNVAKYDIVTIVQDVPREVVLAKLSALLQQLNSGDLLVIYFGGHGIQDRGSDRHLLVLPPGEQDPVGAPFGVLPVDDLRRHTENRGLARGIILDCCRNDDASTAPVALAAQEYTRRIDFLDNATRDIGVSIAVPCEPLVKRGSFAIFCACSEGEVAPEVGDTGSGLFSSALKRVLERAQKVGKSVQLDDTLRKAVEQEMWRIAGQKGQNVRPQPWRSGNGTPELLAGKRQFIRRAILVAGLILLGVLTSFCVQRYVREEAPPERVTIEQVVPVRTAAELAWESAAKIQPGPALDEPLANIETARRNARDFFDQKAYGQAKSAYDSLARMCRDVTELDGLRQGARVSQKQAQIRQSEARHELANTRRTDSKPLKEGDNSLAQGAAELATGDFQEARVSFDLAGKKYDQCISEAKAIVTAWQQAKDAKTSADLARQPAVGVDAQSLATTLWETAEEANRRAAAAETAGLYADAKAAWLASCTAYRQAVQDAQPKYKARVNALTAKTTAVQARKQAQTAGADRDSKIKWDLAGTDESAAQSAFDGRDFAVAEKRWNVAAGNYSDAEQSSLASRQLQLAQASYEAELIRCDQKQIENDAKNEWENVQNAVKAAGSAGEDFKNAAEQYGRALSFLRTAKQAADTARAARCVAEAKALLGQEHFAEAMEQVKEALRIKADDAEAKKTRQDIDKKLVPLSFKMEDILSAKIGNDGLAVGMRSYTSGVAADDEILSSIAAKRDHTSYIQQEQAGPFYHGVTGLVGRAHGVVLMYRNHEDQSLPTFSGVSIATQAGAAIAANAAKYDMDSLIVRPMDYPKGQFSLIAKDKAGKIHVFFFGLDHFQPDNQDKAWQRITNAIPEVLRHYGQQLDRP